MQKFNVKNSKKTQLKMSTTLIEDFEHAFCEEDSHENHLSKVQELINKHLVLIMTVSGMGNLPRKSNLDNMAAANMTYMKTCFVLKRRGKCLTREVLNFYVEVVDYEEEDSNSQEN